MAGDRLESLRALAMILDESLRSVDPEKRAPLAAQYRLTLAEIDALAKEAGETSGGELSGGTPLDELNRRRAARESRASG